MATRVAINGFGRIGRLVFRALVEQGYLGKELDVVAVGDIVPADNLAYLLKYDSVQGRFDGTVESKKSSPDKEEDDVIVVNGKDIKVVSARTPDGLPWKELGVDLVIEATGLFTAADKAQGHLTAGAKKVVITAPAKGDVPTVVLGVNDDKVDFKQHHIISNASCTTNCLAPMVHVVLKEGFGLQEGLMTTVHAYTATHQNVDRISRRPRSVPCSWRTAAQNIIPTSYRRRQSGRARAFPSCKGKLTGIAMRVPVPTGSRSST